MCSLWFPCYSLPGSNRPLIDVQSYNFSTIRLHKRLKRLPYIVLKWFIDANVENCKAVCKANWDEWDFGAKVPEFFLIATVSWTAHAC